MGQTQIKRGTHVTTGVTVSVGIEATIEAIMVAVGAASHHEVTIVYDDIWCCIDAGNHSTACDPSGEDDDCGYLIL